MAETILVVGATGLLGSEICRRLREGDRSVRALVRGRSDRAERLRATGVSLAEGDLKDPASLDAACRGAQTVVSTANAIASRRHGDNLETVDRDGQLALVSSAIRAGASQFIYVSISPGVAANNPFVRYKRQVEQAVSGSGLRWTIVQPSAFMEVHAGPPLGWDFKAGRARVLGSGLTPASYVSVADVAETITRAAGNPAAFERYLHVSGPEPLTALDAVRVAEQVTGRRFRVQRIPTAILKLFSVLLRPVAPVPSSLMAMAGWATPEPVQAVSLPGDGMHRTTFREYVEAATRAD